MKSINLIASLVAVPVILIGFGFTYSVTNDSNANNEIQITNEEVAMTPLVNYDYFEKLVAEVKDHRAKRLVTLETFLEQTKDQETVILDTRSKAMYDLKHVKGAIHLNFADFTQWELDEMFAAYNGRNTKIFIYCNNNFYDSKEVLNELVDPAFVSKITLPATSELEMSEDNDQKETLALNIPTFINLYGYGYRNVYELNEFIDVNDPRIAFEGTFADELSE